MKNQSSNLQFQKIVDIAVKNGIALDDLQKLKFFQNVTRILFKGNRNNSHYSNIPVTEDSSIKLNNEKIDVDEESYIKFNLINILINGFKDYSTFDGDGQFCEKEELIIVLFGNNKTDSKGEFLIDISRYITCEGKNTRIGDGKIIFDDTTFPSAFVSVSSDKPILATQKITMKTPSEEELREAYENTIGPHAYPGQAKLPSLKVTTWNLKGDKEGSIKFNWLFISTLKTWLPDV